MKSVISNLVHSWHQFSNSKTTSKISAWVYGHCTLQSLFLPSLHCFTSRSLRLCHWKLQSSPLLSFKRWWVPFSHLLTARSWSLKTFILSSKRSSIQSSPFFARLLILVLWPLKFVSLNHLMLLQCFLVLQAAHLYISIPSAWFILTYLKMVFLIFCAVSQMFR